VPMPPEPSSPRISYGPTRCAVAAAGVAAADNAAACSVVSPSNARPSRRSAASRTTAASPLACTNASRAPAGRSSAALNSASILGNASAPPGPPSGHEPLAQPGAREAQVALDRRHRDVERGGDVGLLETEQRRHLDDAALALVQRLELAQRGVEAEPGVRAGD